MASAKSPRYYRNDSFKGLPADIREYLDMHFLRDLQHRNEHNPKVLVVFSGGNAVGKSGLAQKIEQELGGVVLENDAIKLHILKLKPAISHDELQHITWQYTMDLYARAAQSITNGLIIRDGVIDWYYDRILPLFEKQGYALFVIAYDLSRKKLVDLIVKRGDKPTVKTDRLLSLLEDHAIHQKRFRKIYTPDITLTDETIFDYDPILSLLRQRIEELK